MSTGARAGFRIYSASDGIEGEVWYAEFDSMDVADKEIGTWLKPFQVEAQNQLKDESEHVIGERIIASITHNNPSGKDFLLIRRNGLVVHFIRSDSFRVAEQIEALIVCPLLIAAHSC